MSGIPEFLVRKVERAIKEATQPQGMGLHDGMARIEASLLARLLQHAQMAAPFSLEDAQDAARYRYMRDRMGDETLDTAIDEKLKAAPQGEGK